MTPKQMKLMMGVLVVHNVVLTVAGQVILKQNQEYEKRVNLMAQHGRYLVSLLERNAERIDFNEFDEIVMTEMRREADKLNEKKGNKRGKGEPS